MAGCKVQTGVANVCGDLRFAGGADSDFWVGYVSDLATSFSIAQTGFLTALPAFLAYSGLVRFSGATKEVHKFDWEWVKGAGGNGFFLHRAALKLIALSTADDVEVQRLLESQDAFIINKNNNGSYLIYGATNGLKSDAGLVGSTGQGFGDDVSDTITMTGPERTKPLRLLVTDDATTRAYLNARLI